MMVRIYLDPIRCTLHKTNGEECVRVATFAGMRLVSGAFASSMNFDTPCGTGPTMTSSNTCSANIKHTKSMDDLRAGIIWKRLLK